MVSSPNRVGHRAPDDKRTKKTHKRSINETIRLDDGADFWVAGGVAGGVASRVGVLERANPPSHRALTVLDQGGRVDADDGHGPTVERAQREHDHRPIQQTGPLCQ